MIFDQLFCPPIFIESRHIKVGMAGQIIRNIPDNYKYNWANPPARNNSLNEEKI